MHFISQPNLGNPHKERKNKRLCKSHSFIRPRMSQTLSTLLKFFSFANVMNCLKRSQTDAQQTDSSNVESMELPTERCKVLQPPRLKQSDKSKHKFNKEEWETLKRPAAKVILDPNTANPSFKLSSDRRSVRTGTHKEFHSNQSYDDYQRKSKHQYNCWTCVQATEGYSKGRHYWEVDVKGKREWRIGVVKESAPRKGFSNLNTATGYWTLCLQLGCVMALTVPVTKLNLAPLSKIGILLDYEEGQVTFYDAVNRKQIYTFKEEFRETVYPVFGTVETDIPLRII